MGRHRADEQPPNDPPSVSGAAAEATDTVTDVPTEAQRVRLTAPTVLVAGPGSAPARASRTRTLVLLGAAVTVALALLTLAIALDSDQPSTTPTSAESAVDGAAGPPTSIVDTPSAAGSAAPTRPVPTTSAAAATTSPAAPSPTTTAPLPATVTGAYSVEQDWGTGFTARVLLTNLTATAHDWQVVIEYPATVTDYVTGWSNAAISPSFVRTARGVTITGQAVLGASQSLGVFVQFANEGTEIAPTLCLVNSTACG